MNQLRVIEREEPTPAAVWPPDAQPSPESALTPDGLAEWMRANNWTREALADALSIAGTTPLRWLKREAAIPPMLRWSLSYLLWWQWHAAASGDPPPWDAPDVEPEAGPGPLDAVALADWLHRHDLTVEDLAEVLQVSRVTVKRWVDGAAMPALLASALGGLAWQAWAETAAEG